MHNEGALKNKKIIISTHVYATGPAQALENFLKDKTGELLYIGHPFTFAKETRSHVRRYIHKKGKRKAFFFPIVVKNQFLSLIKDIILTFYWSIQERPVDLYIGVDCFNAAIGVVLKKIGFVKKTVFYTIDYIPNRSKNGIMNSLYHAIDSFSVKYSDSVWNLSKMMALERRKKGLRGIYEKKQIVVPMGTESDIKKVPFGKIKRYTAVHMGHLIYKQGVQLVIESIPEIIKKFPKFHVDIIGTGDFEEQLKALAKKYHVDTHITWYGYIEKHSVVENMLAKCAFGLAPYIKSTDTYTKFADPGKVKAYIAAHLPVVITKTNNIAREIEMYNCGLAIEYTKHDIIQACEKLLEDDSLLKQMKKNTDIMSKNYRWESIFSKALNSII